MKPLGTDSCEEVARGITIERTHGREMTGLIYWSYLSAIVHGELEGGWNRAVQIIIEQVGHAVYLRHGGTSGAEHDGLLLDMRTSAPGRRIDLRVGLFPVKRSRPVQDQD